MKTSKTFLIALLALGVSALVATAQDENQGPGTRRQRPEGAPGQPGQGGQGGQRMGGGPLMAALDANKDGVIDEKEIANASAALKSLDKNGDGKLTAEEIRPQRPQGQGGQGGPGPDGQGGQRPRPNAGGGQQ